MILSSILIIGFISNSKLLPNRVRLCNKVSMLKRHINAVHNGQKDQKCDPCGKSYSQAWDLKRHTNKAHHNYKDFH